MPIGTRTQAHTPSRSQPLADAIDVAEGFPLQDAQGETPVDEEMEDEEQCVDDEDEQGIILPLISRKSVLSLTKFYRC